MEKLIYFKGMYFVTPEQKQLIIDTFGDSTNGNPYNTFESYDIFNDSNSGLHEFNNLMLYIWCSNPRLTERYDKLVERIKTKGFTASQRYNIDYVEQWQAMDLIGDAIIEFNKEFTEDKLQLRDGSLYAYLCNELMRILGFPAKCWECGIITNLKKALDKIEKSKIDTFDAVECADADWVISQIVPRYQDSAFQENYFTLNTHVWNLQYDENIRKWYKKYPFLAKLMQSSWGNSEWIQIYVYDRATSTKALKIILKDLFDQKLLTKENFVFEKK